MESLMTSEPVDVRWASLKESEFRQAFEGARDIKRIECRSTLCKLEFKFASNAAFEEFGRTLKRAFYAKPQLFHETVTTVATDRASLETLMYLTYLTRRGSHGFSTRDAAG